MRTTADGYHSPQPQSSPDLRGLTITPPESALIHAMLAQPGVAMAIVDLDGRIRTANAKFAGLLHREPESLIGVHFAEITHPADRALDREKAAQLIRGDIDSYTIEKRYQLVDGSHLWGRLTVVLVRDPLGRPDYAVGLVEDIAPRKLAEARHTESERRFARLVETCPDPVIVHQNFTLRFANQAAADLVGAPSGRELVGEDIRRFVHADDQAPLYEQLRQVMEGGGPLRLEHRIRRADGSIGRLESVSDRLEFGGEAAIATIGRDITAQRRAERANRRTVRRLRAMFDHSPVPALLWEIRGGELTLVDMNRTAKTMCEGRARTIIGRTVQSIYHDEPRLRHALEQAAEGSIVPSWQMTYRLRTTGHIFPAYVTCAPIGPRRVIQYMEDLTAKHNAEEQCRQHMDELLHVKRLAAQAKLMASLMHEIAQPVSALSGYVYAMRVALDNESSAGTLRELVDQSTEDTDRILQIMHRMQGLLQRHKAQKVAFAPDVLADRVMRYLRDEADRAGAQMILDAPPDLPPATGDPVQIEQVLMNLVRNAIEAVAKMPESRRGVILRVEAGRDGRLRFAVIDRGPGIQIDAPHRVFEPFFSTKPHGLGMGLSVCQTIVESHNGQLTVESPPEGGCIFRFDLPAPGNSSAGPGPAPSGG